MQLTTRVLQEDNSGNLACTSSSTLDFLTDHPRSEDIDTIWVGIVAG